MGPLTYFANDTSLQDAYLNAADDFAVDSEGNIYIAEKGLNRVLKAQLSTVTIPSTEPSPDFSGDGKVDFTDFLEFAGEFGNKGSEPGFDTKFDLDQDNEIGFGDFLIFAQAFGT